jgi:glutamate dehydrogenase (NAD(P)+)
MQFEFDVDEFGPEKVLIVSDPKTGMKGFLVIDNTARGMGKGGCRMLPNLELKDVLRLARTMTWKNAMANLPLGGAKGGIVADPKAPNRNEIIRAYARSLRNIIPKEYAIGLDMGLTEWDAALVVEELGDKRAATGKPDFLGGIPYDELMITAYGVVESIAMACDMAGISLKGAKVAIQGFGAVGLGVARFCKEKGAVITAVSDSRKAVYDPDGLDIQHLMKLKKSTGSLKDARSGKEIPLGDELYVDCDILVPSARGDVIDLTNVDRVKAKIISEGANFATTREAQVKLHERGVCFVPDFLANSGGIISAYIEMIDGTPAQAFEYTKATVRQNTRQMFTRAREHGSLPLDTAMEMAKERVIKAMKAKGRWKDNGSPCACAQ